MCLTDAHMPATNSVGYRCLHAYIYSQVYKDIRNKCITIKQCYVRLKHCKLHLQDKMYM